MKRSTVIAFVAAALFLFLGWVVRSLTSGRETSPAPAARAPGADPRAAQPAPELADPEDAITGSREDALDRRSPERREGGSREAPVPELAELMRRMEEGGFDGVVLDEAGRPAIAHVESIGLEGGSVGFDTEEKGESKGFFNMQGYTDLYNVKATTLEGGFAVAEELRLDQPPRLVLRLRQGGKVKVQLDGAHESVRCAIFQDEIRHSDFTLRKGQPHEEVVPIGANLIMLYEGNDEDLVVYARRGVQVVPGKVEEVPLSVW